MTDTNTTDNASITLEDVETAVWAIDTASEQGAFKGWEVTAKAFSVRERMVRFLNAARQNQQAAAQAAQAATAVVQGPTGPIQTIDDSTTQTTQTTQPTSTTSGE